MRVRTQSFKFSIRKKIMRLKGLKVIKGRGTCKKVFLILVSNGQLNGEIMKYAFLKFFIP